MLTLNSTSNALPTPTANVVIPIDRTRAAFAAKLTRSVELNHNNNAKITQINGELYYY